MRLSNETLEEIENLEADEKVGPLAKAIAFLAEGQATVVELLQKADRRSSDNRHPGREMRGGRVDLRSDDDDEDNDGQDDDDDETYGDDPRDRMDNDGDGDEDDQPESHNDDDPRRTGRVNARSESRGRRPMKKSLDFNDEFEDDDDSEQTVNVSEIAPIIRQAVMDALNGDFDEELGKSIVQLDEGETAQINLDSFVAELQLAAQQAVLDWQEENGEPIQKGYTEVASTPVDTRTRRAVSSLRKSVKQLQQQLDERDRQPRQRQQGNYGGILNKGGQSNPQADRSQILLTLENAAKRGDVSAEAVTEFELFGKLNHVDPSVLQSIGIGN